MFIGDPVTHPVTVVQPQAVFILVRFQGVSPLRVDALFLQVRHRQIGQVLDGDADGAGLSNLQELQWGSDPRKTDSDADNVADGAEVSAGRNPAVNEAAVIRLLSGDRVNP